MPKVLTTVEGMKPEDFKIIGLTIAEALAKYPNYEFRTVVINSRPQWRTDDWHRDRVNVAIEDNRITEVMDIG